MHLLSSASRSIRMAAHSPVWLAKQFVCGMGSRDNTKGACLIDLMEALALALALASASVASASVTPAAASPALDLEASPLALVVAVVTPINMILLFFRSRSQGMAICSRLEKVETMFLGLLIFETLPLDGC